MTLNQRYFPTWSARSCCWFNDVHVVKTVCLCSFVLMFYYYFETSSICISGSPILWRSCVHKSALVLRVTFVKTCVNIWNLNMYIVSLLASFFPLYFHIPNYDKDMFFRLNCEGFFWLSNFFSADFCSQILVSWIILHAGVPSPPKSQIDFFCRDFTFQTENA